MEKLYSIGTECTNKVLSILLFYCDGYLPAKYATPLQIGDLGSLGLNIDCNLFRTQLL